MEIKDLSLSDLYAAFRFVRIDLKDLEEFAKGKGVKPNTIPAYKEVQEVENKLYHELLNRTRTLN